MSGGGVESGDGSGESVVGLAETQTFVEMQMKLQYMSSQVGEAQTALAHKHALLQDAEDRANQLEEERDETRHVLEETNTKLGVAVERESELTTELHGIQNNLTDCKALLSARVATETALIHEAEALLSSVDLSVINTEQLQKILHEQLSADQEKREAAKGVLAFS